MLEACMVQSGTLIGIQSKIETQRGEILFDSVRPRFSNLVIIDGTNLSSGKYLKPVVCEGMNTKKGEFITSPDSNWLAFSGRLEAR